MQSLQFLLSIFASPWAPVGIILVTWFGWFALTILAIVQIKNTPESGRKTLIDFWDNTVRLRFLRSLAALSIVSMICGFARGSGICFVFSIVAFFVAGLEEDMQVGLVFEDPISEEEAAKQRERNSRIPWAQILP